MSINIQCNKHQEPFALALEGELTIYHTAQVKEQLLDYVKQADELEVDLTQVTDLDGAGVQLLMFVKREAMREGTDLRLTGHSRIVLDIFELLNLAPYFGDPLLISGGEDELVNERSAS